MFIAEHLAKAQRPLFSFELVPPNRGHSGAVLLDVINELLPFHPSWIDVTSHAPFASYKERRDGTIERIISKKRPGTIGICGVIQNRFKIDTVAHLLCHGFSREETEDALIELNYLGVHNVLALKGDGPNFEKKLNGKTINVYASDLVEQISSVKRGAYLTDLEDAAAMDFCVGVAGYPEKHVAAPNLKVDIENLKKKVDAGAEYIVCQMFFDNAKFHSYVEQCRVAGIKVPIVPGLKVITEKNQVSRLPKTFFCDLPENLVQEVFANPQNAREIGIRHTLNQCIDLLEKGAPSLHFYVLNDASAVAEVMRRLKL